MLFSDERVPMVLVEELSSFGYYVFDIQTVSLVF